MKKLLITSLILTVTLSLNAQSWWNNKKIRGNGNTTTVTRSTSHFDEVSVGGSFDVLLVDGPEGKITIEGEENIIPFIITEVRNGTLKIKFKDNTNISTSKRLTVTVPFEKIDGISLGGSGNVKSEKTIKAENISFSIGGSGNIVTEVDAETVKTAIGGSGDIKLTGKSNYLKSSIAGSGSIKAYGLQTNEVKANIAGSGSIRTTVKNKIKATVVGSGSIYYKGKPKYIDVNSIGSGDAIDKN